MRVHLLCPDRCISKGVFSRKVVDVHEREILTLFITKNCENNYKKAIILNSDEFCDRAHVFITILLFRTYISADKQMIISTCLFFFFENCESFMKEE